MLKYYKPTTEVRINSIKSFNRDVYAHKICESHPYTDVIKINWDNAEEEIQKLGLQCGIRHFGGIFTRGKAVFIEFCTQNSKIAVIKIT